MARKSAPPPEIPAQVPPTPARWRIDALALVLTAALGGLAAVASNPLVLGSHGPTIVRPLFDALGYALYGVFALGLWAVLLRAARMGRWRMTARTLGGAVLVLGSAMILDRWFPSLPKVSAFGPGGSFGALGNHELNRIAPSPVPALLLILAFSVGLWLMLPAAVRMIAKASVRINRALGNATEHWFGRVRMPKIRWPKREPKAFVEPAEVEEEPIPLMVSPLLVPSVGPKITRAVTVAELPPEEPEVVDHEPVEDVPIHRHAAPLALRPPTEDENRSNLPEGYELPSVDLLSDPDPFPVADHEQKLRERAALLEKTFADFGLALKVVGIHTGPVITQYEMSLETGLRLNKVTVLSDDIALCLGVSSVRIVAPLPGRSTVGIEVPNEHRHAVKLKEVILATAAKAARMKLPIFMGKDVEGRPLVYDMATMPHLLIAGRTGTGKSVCLNAVIQSFLFSRRPDECRLILIDPKKVEFSDYGRIPHLMTPVVTDAKKAEAILSWAVDKMEERYELLQQARVRNIASYNELTFEEQLARIDPQSEDERKQIPRKIPYIVIVIDEVGDLLMEMKKEVETHIIRLSQKSRAAGIHLILATQKPTVDVITGLIKSNLPARICFQVASRADSMVVLDEKGAEKLLGMGDMLFLQPGTSTIIRGQGAYVSDKEIERVMDDLAQYEPNFESELLNLKAKESSGSGGGDLGGNLRDRDPMYEQAIEIVIREQRGSTSLLQRALGIGYGRASRLIDFMAEDGLVGGFNGSNAREVLVTSEEWAVRRGG
jgi:S-DNA-T family DNA segregation ATPase FtsK/SpoIIIE